MLDSSTTTDSSQFAFITYDGPSVPRDPKTRNLIRRRAMRDVAITRKQRGDSKRNANRGQYPVFLGVVHIVPTGISADNQSLLLSLAPLAGLRLGLAICAAPGVSRAPRLGSTKVFSFIPSRYGHVSALTSATDCVVAKRRAMITGTRETETEADVLAHYSKALRALQVALDDDKQRCTPETLCATQLLGVFELLSVSGKPYSWLRHIGGATRLIQVRGVAAFGDEFELALLTAHVGPAVTEAFLTNQPCFLAETPWQHLLREAILRDESLADYADLVLPLWEHLVGGPLQFKRTTDLLCSPVPPSREAIEEMIECLESARDRLFSWLSCAQRRIGLSKEVGGPDWRDTAVLPLNGEVGEDDADGLHLALRGTYATCRLLKGRLLVALAPERFQHVELESQELAARIMALGESRLGCGSLVSSLFMSQASWIAQSIVETRDIWCDGFSAGEGMIGRQQFEAWCRAMGREID
ncbi:hypothetical protein QBC47DRAFT_412430 [Echria macrotheca]|uniref:Uncharacterized protein n=1 Tax=Echria macrotheca TaxID=438768 RepID=A0AAJ0BFL4_9PEZI|nr:hypothetical protein QBC47DRAFT_412430 [Echria macrotheca]